MRALIFLLLTTVVYSQNTITRTLGDFSQLKVYDLINVELIASDQNQLEITGDNSNDVVIVQKNNALKLKMRSTKLLKGANTYVKLYYKKLNTIDVNEGAVVKSELPIRQYELELKAQEGGEIALEVDTKLLYVKAVTGGIVYTRGKTKIQKLNIRTGGIYQATYLESENTKVKIQTGGQASVLTINELDVHILAGGNVIEHGKPIEVYQKVPIGGRVIFKEKEE